MLDNKFGGAIFHPLTRMKEPSSTKTEAVWTLMELHGQSSYVMYQGCFVSSKNGTLKLSSQLFFFFLFPPQGLCSLVANFYQRLGCDFDFFCTPYKGRSTVFVAFSCTPAPAITTMAGLCRGDSGGGDSCSVIGQRHRHHVYPKSNSQESQLPSGGRQQYRKCQP